MATKTKKNTVKAKYDPNKAYRWNQEETFQFTGVEFDIVQNAISSFIMGEATNVENIAKLIAASQVIKNKIKESVENGKMIEAQMA